MQICDYHQTHHLSFMHGRHTENNKPWCTLHQAYPTDTQGGIGGFEPYGGLHPDRHTDAARRKPSTRYPDRGIGGFPPRKDETGGQEDRDHGDGHDVHRRRSTPPHRAIDIVSCQRPRRGHRRTPSPSPRPPPPTPTTGRRRAARGEERHAGLRASGTVTEETRICPANTNRHHTAEQFTHFFLPHMIYNCVIGNIGCIGYMGYARGTDNGHGMRLWDFITDSAGYHILALSYCCVNTATNARHTSMQYMQYMCPYMAYFWDMADYCIGYVGYARSAHDVFHASCDAIAAAACAWSSATPRLTSEPEKPSGGFVREASIDDIIIDHCGGHDGGAHDALDDSGDVQVMMAEGISLLELRGGGGLRDDRDDGAEDNGCGLLRWLEEDSQWDTHQPRGATRSESGAHDGCDVRESDLHVPGPTFAPRIISGEVHGVRTYVCFSCFGNFTSHDGHATRCPPCGGYAAPASARGRPGSSTDPLAMPRLADIACTQLSPRIPEHVPPPEGCELPPPLADGADQPAPASERSNGDHCIGCNLFLRGGDGVQWRICRCGSTYCVACAVGPCSECAALWPGHPALSAATGADDHDDDHDGDVGRFGYGHIGDNFDDCASRGELSAPQEIPVINPDQAVARRRALIADLRAKRREERAANRLVRRRQVREGRRPHQPRRQRVGTKFVTANVSGFGTLQDELSHNGTLAGAHFMAIQEHKMHDDSKAAATAWLRNRHWDPILDDAYFKSRDYGGGTGVMASAASGGARPLPHPGGTAVGRLTTSIIDLGGDVVFVSLYGISGGSVTDQLPLWSALMLLLIRMGLPFVIAGDWQRAPADLERTGFLRRLGARICAPSEPTNLVTGSVIDWFVVSDPLLDAGVDVRVIHDCRFSPHAPVLLELPARSSPIPKVRRMRRPKPFPIERAVGPTMPGMQVNWDEWDSLDKVNMCPAFDEDCFSAAVESWHAGLEVELGTLFGTIGGENEADYLGLGAAPEFVDEQCRSRYRDVPSEVGLLGHRLAWAAKGLHLLSLHSPTIFEAGVLPYDRRALLGDMVSRIGWRAAAFARERLHAAANFNDVDARAALRRGLLFLASYNRSRHGRLPLAVQIRQGDFARIVDEASGLRDEITKHLVEVAAWKRRQRDREVRLWATTAGSAQLHRATREREVATQKSASADKSHLGELTEQAAADRGAVEWGDLWRASSVDISQDIMRAVEAARHVDKSCPEIVLPPIDEERIYRTSSSFRGGTGTGTDGLRPRHVALATRRARSALASLLTAIERVARWPHLLRWVSAVALGKKAGGARLIGIASAIYRIWAKMRYCDCKVLLESRIARPYLAAAPGKGAEQALFRVNWSAEVATSAGRVMAATMVDVEKFYEYITVAEFASEAIRQGVPWVVVVLTAHYYTGPRILRVGRASSAPVFPARSVVAGCTWATVFVRLLVIPSMDEYVITIDRLASEWEVKSDTTIYIDDGNVTTSGEMDKVVFVHERATLLLLEIIQKRWHKKVAAGKLKCVATTRPLRDALRLRLGKLGVAVGMAGEFLGGDFFAGGRPKVRKQEASRLKKALRRKGRLKWLRRKGGDARQIARCGVAPSIVYGASSFGLRPATRRRLRVMFGATARIGAGGSSLTAKLAIGGAKHADIDPWVTTPSHPLKWVLARLWDEPPCRQDFVVTWRRYHASAADKAPHIRWASATGPISSAMADCFDIGIGWSKPFQLTIDGHIVDILATPPLQILAVVRDQARRHLDHELLERLCVAKGWPTEAVMAQYGNGIEWDTVRDVLEGRIGDLSPVERRGLEVVVCDAYWTDEQKYDSGYLDSASCRLCGWEAGGDGHILQARCGAMAAFTAMRQAAGQPALFPDHLLAPGLEPLAHLGLPPRLFGWEPVQEQPVQGGLRLGEGGNICGDGSGFRQNLREFRVATWAAVRMDAVDNTGTATVSESARGVVAGWFPTVPRAELLAMEFGLRHAAVPSAYLGDCGFAVQGAQQGVPSKLTSSRNFNADLWRRIKWVVDDVMPGVDVIKTKAHRSLTAAQQDIMDGVDNWLGNRAADNECKNLARRIAACDGRVARAARAESEAVQVLQVLAASAAWSFRNVDGVVKSQRRRPANRRDRDENGHSHLGGHLVRDTRRGGAQCVVCRLCCWSYAGRRWLRGKPCRGTLLSQIHSTHDVETNGSGVTWCKACGAYTTRMPRRLRFPCAGRPVSEAQAHVRRRLQAGLPPTTARYLEEAAEDFQVDEAVGPQAQHGQEQDLSPGTSIDGGGGSASVNGVAGPSLRVEEVRARLGRSASSHYLQLESRRRPAEPRISGLGHLGPDLPREAVQGLSVGPAGEPEPCASGGVARVVRRRIVGKQRPAAVPAESGFSSAHHHLHHHQLARATCSAPPAARASRHHPDADHDPSSHAVMGSPLAPLLCMPAETKGSLSRLRAAPNFNKAACHICAVGCRVICRGCHLHVCTRCAREARHCAVASRHHHHRPSGGTEADNFSNGEDASSSTVRAEVNVFPPRTRNEEEPRQLFIVPAVSPSSSVSPLSQGVVSAVVAARAADVPVASGPPRPLHEGHFDVVADLMNVNPTLSPSAAGAALSS